MYNRSWVVVGQPELAWEGIASWLRDKLIGLCQERAIVFLQVKARAAAKLVSWDEIQDDASSFLVLSFVFCSSQLPLRAFYRIGDCIYG